MEKANQINHKPEPEIWTFEVPDVHPSINRWTTMHHFARAELKQVWEHMVYYSAKKAKVPQIDFPITVHIIYHHPRVTVDLDNYTPKFIMDGMKCFFGDDNIKIVKKLDWEFVKGKTKKSIIEIRRFSE